MTLRVADLERAVSFYRDGLGLRTAGIIGTEFEHGAVAFVELQAGLRLALWLRRSLAHDGCIAWAGDEGAVEGLVDALERWFASSVPSRLEQRT